MNTSTTPSVDGRAASDVANDSGPDLDRTSTRLFDPSATEDSRAEVSDDDAHLSDAAPVTALSWLGGGAVDCLVLRLLASRGASRSPDVPVRTAGAIHRGGPSAQSPASRHHR